MHKQIYFLAHISQKNNSFLCQHVSGQTIAQRHNSQEANLLTIVYVCTTMRILATRISHCGNISLWAKCLLGVSQSDDSTLFLGAKEELQKWSNKALLNNAECCYKAKPILLGISFLGYFGHLTKNCLFHSRAKNSSIEQFGNSS